MDVALGAVSWSVYGLSSLVLLAGIVLAATHRRAHPTAARLAVAGLVCVLADKLLGLGIAWFYPRVPPGVGASNDVTRDQRQALELGGLSLDYLVNVVGAIGWPLLLVALLVESSRPRTVHQDGVGDVYR